MAHMLTGIFTVATLHLPVKPVESDSAQKCCTHLRILWVKATRDKKVDQITAGSHQGSVYYIVMNFEALKKGKQNKKRSFTCFTCSFLVDGVSATAERTSAINSRPNAM